MNSEPDRRSHVLHVRYKLQFKAKKFCKATLPCGMEGIKTAYGIYFWPILTGIRKLWFPGDSRPQRVRERDCIACQSILNLCCLVQWIPFPHDSFKLSREMNERIPRPVFWHFLFETSQTLTTIATQSHGKVPFYLMINRLFACSLPTEKCFDLGSTLRLAMCLSFFFVLGGVRNFCRTFFFPLHRQHSQSLETLHSLSQIPINVMKRNVYGFRYRSKAKRIGNNDSVFFLFRFPAIILIHFILHLIKLMLIHWLKVFLIYQFFYDPIFIVTYWSVIGRKMSEFRQFDAYLSITLKINDILFRNT